MVAHVSGSDRIFGAAARLRNNTVGIGFSAGCMLAARSLSVSISLITSIPMFISMFTSMFTSTSGADAV